MKEPLATFLRPKNLKEFIGQKHLVGENGPIKKLISLGKIPSMIFWGPPASGKTTLAEIIANETEADFNRISAVMDGKEKLKEIMERSKQNHDYSKQTILFIDEIHRWNKAQQDALLPFVESGQITLIGATTENPSFEVISALLSRSRVFVFNTHSEEDILEALKRGAKELKTEASHEVLKYLAEVSNGDMRFALNSLEIATTLVQEGSLTKEIVESAAQKTLLYDKSGEEHFNLISAVHKSLRSSNATAGVYYIVRMLSAGEDPLYLARRLLRFASEDIGNAHPTALVLANAVFETCEKLGMPECETALVQLAEFLAKCPKNNKAYTASQKAREDIKRYGNLPVPLHLRNAPTKLMKDIGYSKGYEYDHDLENKKSGQQCLPDELKDRNYFN